MGRRRRVGRDGELPKLDTDWRCRVLVASRFGRRRGSRLSRRSGDAPTCVIVISAAGDHCGY